MGELKLSAFDEQLYTVDEVARRLKISRRTVYEYIKHGRLKAQRIGRSWKLADSNIQKFIRGE